MNDDVKSVVIDTAKMLADCEFGGDPYLAMARLPKLVEHIKALVAENEGLQKANTLLNAGMGSVCEGRDELKHELRTLREEVETLRSEARTVDAEDMRTIATLREENETLKAWKEASDIIDKVGYVDGLNRVIFKESAENAALRARVAALTEGLRPFAYDNFASRCEDDEVAWGGPMVTVGDYRRAAALVKEEAK